MNEEEVTELVKQYSNDTIYLSFTKHDHPAYVKLKAAGPEIIHYLLPLLKENEDLQYGTVIADINPWVIISLLSEITDGDCLATFPEDHAGILNLLIKHIMQWDENKNAK